MSKNLFNPLAFAFFLGFRLVCQADGLVQFPEGDAAWTVTESESSGDSTTDNTRGAASYPTRVEVTQLNNVKRAQIFWSDGKTTERWTIPKLPVVFYQDPRTGLVRTHQGSGPGEILAEMNLTYDKFAFTWLKSDYLKEKDPVSYHNKQCYHYLKSGGEQYSNLTDIHSSREAWIDAKTLNPVGLRVDNLESIFKFQERPPTGPLTPPPAVQDEITYYKAVMGYP